MNRWEDRALPVLIALNESTDHNLRGGILPVGRGNQGATVLALELSDDTILQLGDLDCVEYNNISYTTGGSATFIGLRVTGRGLQVLGQWPRFEALLSPATLAEVVGRLADYAAPEEAPPGRPSAAARAILLRPGRGWKRHSDPWLPRRRRPGSQVGRRTD